MAKKRSVPKDIQKATLSRLAERARRYTVYGVAEVIGTFRGPYLYVSYVEESAGLPMKPPPMKLCRLRHTGDPENWEFSIYKYSDECYDEEGEFPFAGGSVEECFDAAASLYIAECFPDLSPDLPTDGELAEYEQGRGHFEDILGWKMEDGSFLFGPGMVDYLMNLSFQRWREDIESKPIQLNTSLPAALNKQPGVWVEAIYATLVLGDATKKKDRVRAIAAELPAPDFLTDVIEELTDESKQALRFVLGKGGWVKYGQLTRQFGSDEEDGWFWNELPPTSTLGLLRLYGLLFVGKAATGGKRWKVGVIPKDLRPALAEIWPDVSEQTTQTGVKASKTKKRKKRAGGKKPLKRQSSSSAETPIPSLPDRRGMEQLMARVARGLEGIVGPEPGGRLEQAQEMMYQAWEATGRRRIELAEQALEISPDCADAFVLLAEESAHSLEEACRLYASGVEAAERALGPETFQENAGYFWGALETQPYMRARAGLAECLWKMEEHQAAIGHYQDMLRLNPNDNQGIRYLLAACYATLGDDARLEELLNCYLDEASAAWLYTRALLLFRQAGDTPGARSQIKEAMEYNPHVPAYLLGRKRLPRQLPAHLGVGDENEAVHYAAEFSSCWQSTPGAPDWLARQAKE